MGTRFCVCQISRNQPDTTKRELDSAIFLKFSIKNKKIPLATVKGKGGRGRRGSGKPARAYGSGLSESGWVWAGGGSGC